VAVGSVAVGSVAEELAVAAALVKAGVAPSRA